MHHFTFNKHLVLMCNGTWVPDDPFNEADGRRLTGLHFPIKYKNNPEGPNEAQKDATLKHRVHDMIPEFWFIARVFWLCTLPYPKADQTLPKCPCTQVLVTEMMGKAESMSVREEDVNKFLKERTMAYKDSAEKPSSCDQIVDDFCSFYQKSRDHGSHRDFSRATLEKVVQDKKGHTIKKHGNRPKTSINAFLKLINGVATPITLKPAQPASGSISRA